MDDAPDHAPARDGAGRGTWLLVAAVVACLLLANVASACDGKSYAFSMVVGEHVDGGGLSVRLDRAKLEDVDPDKYFISVKDDGEMLADHLALIQHNSVDLKTKCGTLSIAADRASLFSHGTIKLSWSYF